MAAKKTDNTIYKNADLAIHRMNKRSMRRFDRLKTFQDELNLIREIERVYLDGASEAVTEYVGLAVRAFTEALVMCGKPHGTAERLARKYMTRDWVLEVLEMTDPVTRYVFSTETERKAARLSEAVAVPTARQAEIERALRYWTKQTGQYAITIVDQAMIAAFMVAGIKRVRWNTENDSAVCPICDKLDGRVFSIQNVPPKQHYNCRCWLTPYLH